jgi:hypothetical protein
MQGAQSSSGQQSSSTFASALARSRSLFTPKRVGFTLAGAFVFAGAAAAVSHDETGHHSTSKSQNFTVQTTTDGSSSAPEQVPDAEAGAAQPSDSTSSGSASNSNSTSVQVNVNGQNIDVPDNGSVSTTVPSQDGTGQSSVNVNSSQNNSSSSLNVNISSNSNSSNGSSSSHMSITQSGGTTHTSTH